MNIEQKKKNFNRIAEARVSKLLDLIKLLGNLSNSSFYYFEEKDIDLIFAALREGINVAEIRFRISKKKKGRFIL